MWAVVVGPGPALPQPEGLPPGLPVDPLGRVGTRARVRGGCSLGPLRKDFLGKWQKGWRGRLLLTLILKVTWN